MVTEIKPSLEVLFDSAYDGQFNMAFDESLFRKQIQKTDPNSILRFYRFSVPTLTIGYGMWKAAREQESLIRRLTGGGIVSHTPDDLTYSLITPISSRSALKKVRDSYFFIHKVLTNSLNALSIHADLYERCDKACETEKISYCFDSPVLHDVMLKEKKIAGAGQKRSFGYLLHQGSIAWSEILRENPSLNEQEFCDRFSSDLARELNL